MQKDTSGITVDCQFCVLDNSQNFCCTEDLQFPNKSQLPPTCDPIVIPPNDPYYSKRGAKCIAFARVFTDKGYGCGEDNKPVEQVE